VIGRLAGIVRDSDLRVLELGDELRHRIREPDPSFFDEHQHGGGRDRLGQRGQRKDSVLRHRLPGLEVQLAARLEVQDLSIDCDKADGPGNLAGLDAAVDHLADAQEPLTRHSVICLFASLGCDRRGKDDGNES
jgi:hypothetical protein